MQHGPRPANPEYGRPESLSKLSEIELGSLQARTLSDPIGFDRPLKLHLYCTKVGLIGSTMGWPAQGAGPWYRIHTPLIFGSCLHHWNL